MRCLLSLWHETLSEAEPKITLEEVYPTTLRYHPGRDLHWRVIEDEASYIRRMRERPLANWPEELLKEWLYRHADQMEDYAFLGFENLRFSLETWNLDRIPAREVFREERFCDSFQDVEDRARDNPYDWLAHYMLKEGTWNTPIVLFENHSAREIGLKSPFHLLEGHRRLSFLQGLKRLSKARPDHQIWVARLG